MVSFDSVKRHQIASQSDCICNRVGSDDSLAGTHLNADAVLVGTLSKQIIGAVVFPDVPCCVSVLDRLPDTGAVHEVVGGCSTVACRKVVCIGLGGVRLVACIM